MQDIIALFRVVWIEGNGGKRRGGGIPCLDNKMRGKGFGRKIWTSFIKNAISPKEKRVGRKTLSFLFPSLPFPSNKQYTLSLLITLLPFSSFPFPFPFPFPSFLLSPNLLSKHRVRALITNNFIPFRPCMERNDLGNNRNRLGGSEQVERDKGC